MSGLYRGAYRGFTLVELLVVISIIALLISILLPSLERARATARQVACSSNMRQIATADTMYADSYDGWYVPVVWPSYSNTEGYSWAWNPGFRSSMGLKPVRSEQLTNPDVPVSTKSSYGAYPPGMTCPSMPQWQREVGDLIHSYGMNMSIGADWSYPGNREAYEPKDDHYAWKRNAIPHKAEKIKTVDANEWRINLFDADYMTRWDLTGPPAGWWGGQTAVTYRHQEGANLLYFDGHVEYMKKEEAYPLDQRERRRMWLIDEQPRGY